MEHILGFLVDSVDEITGAFLYNINSKIIFNRMPAEYSADTLHHIGQTMVRNLTIGKEWFPDIVEVSLHFMESNITAKEIHEQGLLVVMFNPSINKQKLHMSLELALEGLAEEDV